MATRDEVARDLTIALINQHKEFDADDVAKAYRAIYSEVNASFGTYAFEELSPIDYKDGKAFSKD